MANDLSSPPKIALPNKLGYRVLGVIARRPSCGYDIMKAMQRFRPVKISQIYKALSDMEAAEILTVDEVIQHGKPNKKVYEMTPEGARVLNDWVSAPTEPPTLNDDFVAKVYSMWHAPHEERTRLITDRIEWLNEEIDHFEALQSDLHRTAPDRLQDPNCWEFSRDMLITRHLAVCREDLLWCQRTLTRLTTSHCPAASREETR